MTRGPESRLHHRAQCRVSHPCDGDGLRFLGTGGPEMLGMMHAQSVPEEMRHDGSEHVPSAR